MSHVTSMTLIILSIYQASSSTLCIVMLALVNIFSSKGVVRLMQVVSSLKFVAIVFIIILGCVKLFSGQSRFIGASLALGVHFDIVKFVLAMYAAFWAYEGWYVYSTQLGSRMYICTKVPT